MSNLREPQSQRPPRRVSMPGLSGASENRSVQIGLVGTVLVHLLMFLIVPILLRFEHGSMPIPRAVESDPFEIELGPEYTEEVEKPDLLKFVEVNPDAPENEPDKTENFSSQNQQAAQEEESLDMSGDRPAIEGQTEIKSERIVSGQLAPFVPPLPSAPQEEEVAPDEKKATPAQREQIPLSGFTEDENTTEDSFGTAVTKLVEGDSESENYIPGIKDAPLVEGASSLVEQINPSQPRPRPKLQKRARPAIFTQSNIGTDNIGPIGLDARWSSYGQYLQELIETVQIQWDRILTQSKVYPPVGTKVIVGFILNQKGEITRITSVESSSGELSKQVCVSAITNSAPYGEWTEDMKNVLGEEQQMTFTFYYQ